MQNRPGNPQVGGGYTQPGFCPPWPPTNWGPPGQPPMQQPGYGYMQPGAYLGPQPQYNMSQGSFSGYPQPQSSGGYPSGWCQALAPANPQSATSGGYDYYGQQPPSNYNPQGSYGGESNYSQPPFGQRQGYGYGNGYNIPAPQPGYYGQPQSNRQSVYDHQGYGSAPTYGNPNQDGARPSYGGQAGSAPRR